MKAQHPNYLAAVQAIFDQALFIRDLGIRLVDAGPGWCETELALAPKHLQQHDYVHAGVQATLADHTAGAAGTTLIGPGQHVLTVEFKVNLLNPASGERLSARAQVLRPGHRLIVAESEVLAWNGEEAAQVAKALVTLAVKGGS